MPPNSFALRVLICSLLLCAIGRAAQATTITVINTNDSGAGSLRQAVADTNDGDTIDFDPALNGQTIMLTTAELVIGKSITINGPGANLLAVSRANNAPEFRVFHVMAGLTVVVQGLTISNGSAFEFGCGGGILDDGDAVISSSTVIGNNGQTAGAIVNRLGTLEMKNTVLNRGDVGPNMDNDSGTVISHGYNLCNDNCAFFLNGAGDEIYTDPILGPLQDNGGPTFTHELLKGSPAIDAGDPTFTPPPLYDQRGPDFYRVMNGHIDIGSFEVQSGPPPPPTPTPTATA